MLLAACEAPERPLPEVEVGQAPSLYVALDAFDPAAAGGASTAVLQLQNTGTAPLDVHAVFIDGDSQFVFESVAPFQLAPAELLGLPILYRPDHAGTEQAEGSISVLSNDPQQPTVSMPLAAVRLDADLQFSELRLDLGVVDVPCGTGGTLSVRNDGDAELVIDALEVSGDPSLTVLGRPSGTVRLPPGEHAPLDVMVDSVEVGPASARVTALPRGGEPRWADIVVRGTTERWRTERFVQDAGRYAMLMVVDRDSEWVETEKALQSGVPELVEALSQSAEHWSLGIVTADSGCVNLEVFDETSSHVTLGALEAVRGASGEFSNSLLELVDRATALTGAGQCNEGLFDPSAPLHVVVVSDSDDASGLDIDGFINTVSARMADPSLLTVSGVIDVAGTCAESSTRYLEVIERTGGLPIDVCDEVWAPHLQEFPSWAAPMPAISFPLSTMPMPETLSVSIDGGMVSSGWSYLQDAQIISFDAPPASSARVEVTYAPYDLCE